MSIDNLNKTIFTTLSGLFGGMGRVMVVHPLEISFFRSFEVCFFAALSALTGYIVKCLIDRAVMRFRRRKRQNKKSHE